VVKRGDDFDYHNDYHHDRHDRHDRHHRQHHSYSRSRSNDRYYRYRWD
jgi:hypothetical protein